MLVYVVDSNDTERIDEARHELHGILADAAMPENATVLVFANKQDLPNAKPLSELAERLGLTKLRGRKWHVQSACGLTGDGLYEGFDWASEALKQARGR